MSTDIALGLQSCLRYRNTFLTHLKLAFWGINYLELVWDKFYSSKGNNTLANVSGNILQQTVCHTLRTACVKRAVVVRGHPGYIPGFPFFLHLDGKTDTAACFGIVAHSSRSDQFRWSSKAGMPEISLCLGVGGGVVHRCTLWHVMPRVELAPHLIPNQAPRSCFFVVRI